MKCWIHRKRHASKQIDLATLLDVALSPKARGVLVYCLALPLRSRPAVASLRTGGAGREIIQAALHELSEHGYAELRTMRGPGGRLAGQQWHIYETPAMLVDEHASNDSFDNK